MDGALNIAKRETGVLRIFGVTDDVWLPFHFKGDDFYLESAIGFDNLDPQHVQGVAPTDLTQDELKQLLVDGYDIAEDDIDMAQLAPEAGPFIIIRSAAFTEKPATLKLSKNAKMLAVYVEQSAPPPNFTPLQSDAAQGVLTSPPAPDTKPSAAKVWLVALILACVLFVLVMGAL